MKNVIILLSVFLFLFVAGVGFAGESKSSKKDTYFSFNYNELGELVSIQPAPSLTGCEEVARGETAVNAEIAKRLKDGYRMTVPAPHVILLHKNPTCWIQLGNLWVCWCCN